MIDKKLLIECPTVDYECPYYSWKYHKCAMMAHGEGDPRKECDNYWDDEELDMAQRLWNLEAEDSPDNFGETDESKGW